MKRASFLGVGVLLATMISLYVAVFSFTSSGMGFIQSDGLKGENGPNQAVPSLTSALSTSVIATLGGSSGSGAFLAHKNIKIASVLPSASPQNISIQDSLPTANWDEQLGLSFTQNFTSLSYNVTAVQQADVDGYGPTYLLNGLSSVGYWYQVGLSWNWSYTTGGYDEGFHMNYQVFNSTGSSIFPVGGNGGLENIIGTVNPGDTVGLYLYFSNGDVVMSLYDFNTGASARENYSAEGSTLFVGTPYTFSDSNGFFTGLMTEQYHVAPYYGDESSVFYSDATFSLSSAYMWIDEYYNRTNPIFSNQSLCYYSNTSLQVFSLNGSTEYSNASQFITGTGTYLGIIVSVSDAGTVYYDYSQGSGSVASGTSFTLFGPRNGTISLEAHPSSFFYQFSQWSGVYNSTSTNITLVAQAPGQIQASFVLNWINIGIVAVIIIVVVAILGWLAALKRLNY